MKNISDLPKNILDVPVNLIKQLSPIAGKKTASKVGLPPGSIVHIGQKKIEKVKIENNYKQKKNRLSYEKNLHLHPGHPTDHRQK